MKYKLNRMLTDKDLRKIREELEEAGGYKAVAEKMKCHPTYVGQILRDLKKANRKLAFVETAVNIISDHKADQERKALSIKAVLS